MLLTGTLEVPPSGNANVASRKSASYCNATLLRYSRRRIGWLDARTLEHLDAGTIELLVSSGELTGL
jgi:hypothetical protein